MRGMNPYTGMAGPASDGERIEKLSREVLRLRAELAEAREYKDRYPPGFIEELQHNIDVRNVEITRLTAELAEAKKLLGHCDYPVSYTAGQTQGIRAFLRAKGED